MKIGYVPLTDLNLTVRFNSVLERTNIKTLQDLLNTPPIELLHLRNCGEKSIRDTQYDIRFFANEHPEIFDGKYIELKEEIPDVIFIPLFGEVKIEFANRLDKIKNIHLCQIDLPIRKSSNARRWECHCKVYLS